MFSIDCLEAIPFSLLKDRVDNMSSNKHNATTERKARLGAIAQWAKVGVLKPRELFSIEEIFMKRVEAKTNTFFRPIQIGELNSVEFNRQLSYLIDAFDSLPGRVDIAFDSTWKAFELETREFAPRQNITDRLRTIAEAVDKDVIDLICSNFPVQSCEYLYKRLISDVVDKNVNYGLKNRINYSKNNQQICQLLEHLELKYKKGSSVTRRNGALLIRRALEGEQLKLANSSGVTFVTLGSNSKTQILISLFLYTARNERVHGSTFSPFISSAASLRTYTHPYFAFLATYYLLISLWKRKHPQVLILNQGSVITSLKENIEIARKILGSNWNN